MNGPSVAERLERVNARIAAAAARASRAPGSARLLAVSKLHAAESIARAWDSGQRDFGENYVQEALTKIDAWDPARPLEWHFIGRIQSNKAKSLANRFALIHSVDRFEIAERLDRATATRQNVCVQLNVADEASKAGAAPDEVSALVRRIVTECPRLVVVGLMVMPPLNDDPERTRPYFRAARELLADLKRAHPRHPLDQLSMGTTGDFEVAIEEGATWVRIGTDVFGPR